MGAACRSCCRVPTRRRFLDETGLACCEEGCGTNHAFVYYTRHLVFSPVTIRTTSLLFFGCRERRQSARRATHHAWRARAEGAAEDGQRALHL